MSLTGTLPISRTARSSSLADSVPSSPFTFRSRRGANPTARLVSSWTSTTPPRPTAVAVSSDSDMPSASSWAWPIGRIDTVPPSRTRSARAEARGAARKKRPTREWKRKRFVMDHQSDRSHRRCVGRARILRPLASNRHQSSATPGSRPHGKIRDARRSCGHATHHLWPRHRDAPAACTARRLCRTGTERRISRGCRGDRRGAACAPRRIEPARDGLLAGGRGRHHRPGLPRASLHRGRHRRRRGQPGPRRGPGDTLASRRRARRPRSARPHRRPDDRSGRARGRPDAALHGGRVRAPDPERRHGVQPARRADRAAGRQLGRLPLGADRRGARRRLPERLHLRHGGSGGPLRRARPDARSSDRSVGSGWAIDSPT